MLRIFTHAAAACEGGHLRARPSYHLDTSVRFSNSPVFSPSSPPPCRVLLSTKFGWLYGSGSVDALMPLDQLATSLMMMYSSRPQQVLRFVSKTKGSAALLQPPRPKQLSPATHNGCYPRRRRVDSAGDMRKLCGSLQLHLQSLVPAHMSR